MVIDGGNNDPNGYSTNSFIYFTYWKKNKNVLTKRRLPFPSDGSIALTSLFAVGTGSIAANLEQVPNQPMVFKVIKFIL